MQPTKPNERKLQNLHCSSSVVQAGMLFMRPRPSINPSASSSFQILLLLFVFEQAYCHRFINNDAYIVRFSICKQVLSLSHNGRPLHKTLKTKTFLNNQKATQDIIVLLASLNQFRMSLHNKLESTFIFRTDKAYQLLIQTVKNGFTELEQTEISLKMKDAFQFRLWRLQ